MKNNNQLGVNLTTKRNDGHNKRNCKHYKKWSEKNKNKGNKELVL